MSEHAHHCADCGRDEVRDSENLHRLADAAEEMVKVVRDSLRVPVVFNITNEKLSHEQGSAIAEKLRRLLNPATVRDVDLTPEAVPHD